MTTLTRSFSPRLSHWHKPFKAQFPRMTISWYQGNKHHFCGFYLFTSTGGLFLRLFKWQSDNNHRKDHITVVVPRCEYPGCKSTRWTGRYCEEHYKQEYPETYPSIIKSLERR